MLFGSSPLDLSSMFGVHSFAGLLLFDSSTLDLSLCVQCSYSVRFGSSPCWLNHCVSTPCDLNTAAVPRWFSWFFALLARSQFSPCWLDHCVSTPCYSITAAVPRWISCVYSFVGSVLFGSSSLDLSRRPSVQCSYSVLFSSSPC